MLFILLLMLGLSPENASARSNEYLIMYNLPAQISAAGLAQEVSTFQNFEKSVLSHLRPEVQQSSRTLWIANSSLATLSNAERATLLSDSRVRAVMKIGRKGKLTNYTYGLKRIKIPELRAKFFGLDGAFVRLGVIDTGVDARHPDLFGRIVAYKDYIDTRITTPRDDHGHGTHVAGTMAGAVSASQSVGVAPRAELLVAKTFDSRGSSKDSDMLLAMQWLADPDQDPATNDFPRAINSSWNVDGDVTKIDHSTEPFCVAISKLKSMGIASVVAAGNDGPGKSSIKIPGACPDAITVAATDDRDTVTDFSSRGPAVWANGAVAKPDISAPGKGVNSADTGGGYRTRSGTSMASPHVAGFLGLFFQREPGKSVDEAIANLRTTATDLGPTGTDVNSGAGLLNTLKSIESL
jgi:subtilisin family serine protease